MKTLFLFLTFFIIFSAKSDVLIIERLHSSQGADLPLKGTTMNQVELKYGKAISVKGPIGTPPITTWKYDTFSVYFEHQHVIHAVVHKANENELGPKPIQ
jgi:hypothetical protein